MTWTASFTPIAVLLLLAAVAAVLLACSAAMVLRRRSPLSARRLCWSAAGIAGAYLAGLLLSGAVSRSVVLRPGGEKYFCELDCHLAYRVVGVRTMAGAAGPETEVVLETWFDEHTIAASRSRSAPTVPGPRRVRLLGPDGRERAPVEAVGAVFDGSSPISAPLRPGERYRTLFRFAGDVEPGTRLWVTDDLAVSPLLIGHERSPWHARVLLALPPVPGGEG